MRSKVWLTILLTISLIVAFAGITMAATKINLSVVSASPNDGNLPGNVLDGNLSTRFSSNGDGAYIILGADSAFSVETVKIAWHNGNTRQFYFEIFASLDNISYTKIYPATGNATSSGTTTSLETYNVTDGVVKYLKVVGHKNSFNSWFSPSEIEAWGSTAAPTPTTSATPTPSVNPTPTPTTSSIVSPQPSTPSGNLALNRQVSYSSQQSGNEAHRVVDGSTSTRWSADTYPEWICVDLGAIYSINKVEVAPYSNRAYQYRVEVSTDNSVFTMVVDRTNNTTTGSVLSNTFAMVNARYVRLTVTGCANYTGTWASINEFRVFNTDSTNSSPTVTPTVTPTLTPTPTITPVVSSTPTPTPSPGPSSSTGKPCDAGLNQPFQTPNPVTGRTINVLSYGATANNANDDDATAFAAAISAAQYGDEVLIPNGTFHIKTRRILLKSGVSLRGESKTGSVLAAHFNSVSENAGSYLLEAEGGVHDLTISNFTISMTGGQALNYALFLGKETASNVYRIAVKDMIITGFAKNGVGVRNGNFILIQNCIIKDATQTGGGGYGYGVMLGYDNTQNCWVNNNYIGPNIRHAVLIQYRAHHNLVDYNTAEATTEDSYDLHGEDEYSNEIAYNKAFNCAASGIGIGNTGGTPEHYNAGPNNWIHHNEVWNSEHGFNLFRESDYTYIEDNYFHHNGDEGMYIYNEGGDYVVLRRNRSMYNGSGARIENARYLLMEDNIVTNNTGFAMKTNTGTVYYTIKNNDFRNNGDPVELGSTNGTYTGNLE